MLRLPAFDYRRPASVAEAAAILAGEGPGAALVAGGTDLWPNLKRRQIRARTVVSLASIPGLRRVDGDADGELRIGATARLAGLAAHPAVRERYPALARALDGIASPPIRTLATLGGNLCLDTRCNYYDQSAEWRRAIDFCMKAEGEVCWVAPSSRRCWAHSASDSAPVLAALGARVRLASAAGERTVPVAELYRDDGIDYLAKDRGEILTEVLLPAESAAGRCRSAFRKLRRRGAIDFAVLSVAAAAWPDGKGKVERAEIFLGAVASRPLPVPEAAAALAGDPLGEDTIAEAARLARRAATPMDNTDFQAQWRGKMVEVTTARVLREIAGLAS